jgi:hypothetical protein
MAFLAVAVVDVQALDGDDDDESCALEVVQAVVEVVVTGFDGFGGEATGAIGAT